MQSPNDLSDYFSCTFYGLGVFMYVFFPDVSLHDIFIIPHHGNKTFTVTHTNNKIQYKARGQKQVCTHFTT